MSVRTQAARQYLDAQIQRDEEAMQALVSQDVRVLDHARGVQYEGRDALLERLRAADELIAQMPGVAATVSGAAASIPWQEPVEDGDRVRIGMDVPSNSVVRSVAMVFTFNAGDEITQVESVVEMTT